MLLQAKHIKKGCNARTGTVMVVGVQYADVVVNWMSHCIVRVRCGHGSPSDPLVHEALL